MNYLCAKSSLSILKLLHTLYPKIEVNSARRVLQGSLLTGKVTLFHRTLTRAPLYSILEGSTRVQKLALNIKSFKIRIRDSIMERLFVVSGLYCLPAEERLRDFPDSDACHEYDPASRKGGWVK